MKKYNKFTQTLLWLFVACMSVITGCVDDAELTASFDTTIMKYDAAAQNIPYTITSNGEWTISSDKDWCTTSVSEGNGTTGIDIVLAANDTSEERLATLTLKCNGKSSTLRIVQSAQLCSLSVSPLAVALGVASESFDIAITSNTSWVASSEDSWINSIATKGASQTGSGNAILTVTADKNDTYKDRVGTVSVYASSNDGSATLIQTVVVSQSANSTATIVLSTTSLSFESDDDGASDAKTVSYYGTAESLAATTDDSWCSVSVSGSTITVTPTSNTKSSASRFAVVTVTATVNGVEATEQITVSQDGALAPEIYLYNSAYSVSASATSATLNWLNINNTTIKSVNATDSWATAASVSNTSAAVTFTANTEVESRSTTIRIEYEDLMENTCYKEIQLTQAGVGAPTIFYNDLSLTSAASEGTFHVIVDNTAAKVGDVTVTTGSWLSASATISSGDITVTYKSDANNSDSNRENTIYIAVEIGSSTYLCSVNVSQNGLGAPEVTTLTNVYVGAAASDSSYTQSLWITGGDATNVTYEVYYTYSSTTTTADPTWISSVEVVDNKLEVVYLQNILNESRSAVITLVAARGASTSTVDIMFTQAGTASAGIVGLSQEIYHDYKADEVELAFEYINNSTATVTSSTSTMLSDVSVAEGPVVAYTISEYTGGEAGSYRQGIITLKVTNDNEYPVYYDILITQTAPEDPSIDAPDVVYIPYTGVGGTEVKEDGEGNEVEVETNMSLPINLLNSAEITSTTPTYQWGTTETGWLNVTLSSTGVTYTAEPYTGGDGASRSVTVSFTVENSSANASLCTIEFIQGESDTATASVPAVVTVTYEAKTNDFDVTLSSAVGAFITGVAYATDNIGLFDTSVDPKNDGSKVSFAVTKNTTTSQRSGHVIVTVAGTNSYDTSVYYVPVTQLTADEVVITAPTSTLSYSNIAGEYSFPISATYGGTVSATSSDASWLTIGALVTSTEEETETVYAETATGLTTAVDIALTAYTGNEEYREAFITLSVENANSSEKNVIVTVRQYKDGSAYVTAPTAVTVGATEFSVSVPYSLGANVEDSEVSATSTDGWLVAKDATGTVTISAEANTAAESREGYVAIAVENNSGEVYTHYITVTQAGTEDATADVPTTINVAYAGETITLDTSNVENVESMTLTEVSNADKMVTIYVNTTKFDVHENTSIEARYALLKLTVTGVNGNVAFYYINVNQAGAPNITLSVPSTVYVGSVAVEEVAVPVTSSETVTVESSQEWLTAVVEDGNVLITTTDNTAAESREAYITVTSTNAAGESISEMITVTQAGTEDAEADVPTTLSVGYEGNSALKLPINITDGTASLLVSQGSDFITILNASATLSDSTSSIAIKVAENETTEARYATLSLTVTGTNDNVAIYYINVNQDGAPAVAAPTLEVPANVSFGAAEIEEDDALTIPMVSDSSVISATPSADWLKVTEDNEIYASANEDTTSSREAYITVVAGETGNQTTKIITVTQAAAEAVVVEDAVASVATTVNVAAAGVTTSVASNISTGATTTLAFVSGSADMVTISGTSITVAKNETTLDRFALLSLTVASGEDATYNTSVYYINVNQAAAAAAVAPSLELPAAISFSYAEIEEDSKLSVAISTDATSVTATPSETWFEVTGSATALTITADANASAYSREGYITVVAGEEGNTTTKIVTVTQSGVLTSSTATLPSTVTLSKDAVSDLTIGVTLASSADATTAAVATVYDAFNMISAISYADGTITYSVNENVSGSQISALISFSVSDADSNQSIYYVTINQTAITATTTYSSTPISGSDAGVAASALSTDFSSPTALSSGISSTGVVESDDTLVITADLDNSSYLSDVSVESTSTFSRSVTLDGSKIFSDFSWTEVDGKLTITGTKNVNYGAARDTEMVTVTLTSHNGDTDKTVFFVNQAAAPDVVVTVPTIETIAWDATSYSLEGFSYNNVDLFTSVSEVSVTGDIFDGTPTFENLVLAGTTTANYGPARTSTVTIKVLSSNGNVVSTDVALTQAACPDVALADGYTSAITIGAQATTFSVSGLTLAEADYYDSATVVAGSNSIFSNATFTYDSTNGAISLTSGSVSENDGAERTATLTLTLKGKNGNGVKYDITVTQVAPPTITLGTTRVNIAQGANTTYDDVVTTSTVNTTNATSVSTSTISTAVSASYATSAVTLTAKANTATSAVESTITVTASNDYGDTATANITVYQYGTNATAYTGNNSNGFATTATTNISSSTSTNTTISTFNSSVVASNSYNDVTLAEISYPSGMFSAEPNMYYTTGGSAAAIARASFSSNTGRNASERTAVVSATYTSGATTYIAYISATQRSSN